MTRNLAAFDIAKTGTWEHRSDWLSGDKHCVIFGDPNQQGTINPPHCERGQNGRGGMFFVVENNDLFNTVTGQPEGESEIVKAK
jgi:hypothetical protein